MIRRFSGLFGSTAAGAGSIDVSSAFFGVCTTELMFACAGCGASIGEAGIGEAGIVEAGIAGALVSVTICNSGASDVFLASSGFARSLPTEAFSVDEIIDFAAEIDLFTSPSAAPSRSPMYHRSRMAHAFLEWNRMNFSVTSVPPLKAIAPAPPG